MPSSPRGEALAGNSSGRRLRDLLDAAPYDAVNLFAMPRPWTQRAAHKAALRLLRQHDDPVLILCGRKVQEAFGFINMRPCTWHVLGPRRLGMLPHPSGRNRWYNDPGNVSLARSFLAAT